MEGLREYPRKIWPFLAQYLHDSEDQKVKKLGFLVASQYWIYWLRCWQTSFWNGATKGQLSWSTVTRLTIWLVVYIYLMGCMNQQIQVVRHHRRDPTVSENWCGKPISVDHVQKPECYVTLPQVTRVWHKWAMVSTGFYYIYIIVYWRLPSGNLT